MMKKDFKEIKAIAFDFGGTLDIPGVHWFDFFWNQFGGQFGGNQIMSREQYWDAYVFGERQMEKYGIPRTTSFQDTLTKKLSYQFEYLAKEGYLDENDKNLETFISIFTMHGLSRIEESLKKASELIEKLSKVYDVSIVSNYYGNLETILHDAGIIQNLNRLLDSTLVGIRKPDPAIWKMALDQSGYKAEEFLIIGDSMKNDILPAQSIGCPTIWITTKETTENYNGYRVNSLDMLADFFGVELSS